MTDEMKLRIAKLRADGYDVEVIVNHNQDKWEKYISDYEKDSKNYIWMGACMKPPKHPSSFVTTDFKITKEDKK
jgi:hypothetical protein